MYEINHKTLHDLTVEDVETAAKAAFIEGIMWAQKYNGRDLTC